MGSYATTTSISELLPQWLAGNTTASDTVGTNIFSRHVDRAEGRVNSYLGSRYSVPFSPVPVLIRQITEDIATWMFIRGTGVQDVQLLNPYLAAFERALDTLDEIRDGKIKLVDTAGSLVATQSSKRFLSSTEEYSHIFNMDTASSWRVDDDQVDDIADSRNG